jgi:hypothetical protein
MPRKKAKRELTTKRLREIAAFLRREFPVPDKVLIVRRMYKPDADCGWTIFDGRYPNARMGARLRNQPSVPAQGRLAKVLWRDLQCN